MAKYPNNLEELWEDQKEFNKNFVDFENLTKEEKVEKTKHYALELIDEIMELMRETSWKTHRKEKSGIIRSNLLEEYIDMLKYLVSIGQIWDIKPKEVMEEYKRKSDVVEQRYKQEKQLNFDGPIAGIDIDGVIAKYPEYFLKYAKERAKINVEVDELRNYNLYQALNLPIELTKEIKHEFRKSGKLKDVPIMKDARKFLYTLRDMGYKVVLLSARPYKKYKRIFADTKFWLDHNRLYHDAILWGEDKCSKLIREFGKENVKFFVEDNLENANDIGRITKTFLLDRPYNQGEIKDSVIRFNNFKEIIEVIENVRKS